MVIDWEKVISNLNKDLKLEQIADDSKVPVYVIRRLKRGELLEPDFSHGLRILNLHHDHCPEQHDKSILLEEQ